MKLSKKLMLSGIALIMAAPLATKLVEKTNVHAATGEIPMQTVLTVKSPYSRPYGVRLVNEHNEAMQQLVYVNQSFKVFGMATIGGRPMYRIGNQSQWIPAEYANVDLSGYHDQHMDDKKSVTIKYIPGYSIAVWNKPTTGRNITGKYLKHGTSWKVFDQVKGSDGYTWYNLGGNQWISSQYAF